jgi:hypothetical protein
VDADTVRCTLGKGSYFGEYAMLLEKPVKVGRVVSVRWLRPLLSVHPELQRFSRCLHVHDAC